MPSPEAILVFVRNPRTDIIVTWYRVKMTSTYNNIIVLGASSSILNPQINYKRQPDCRLFAANNK